MVYRSILCALAAAALSGAPCFASGEEETDEVVVQPTEEDESAMQPADEVLPDSIQEAAPEGDAGPAAPLPEAQMAVPVPGRYPVYSPFPPMSYNYYYPGYNAGILPARLYFSPRPVPLYVGYTYITYQALAPHEFLWPHARCYYQYHPGSGTTVTTIKYR